MAKVTARCMFRGEQVRDVPVLNPGAWRGKTWLLVLDTSHDPDLFIVEADGPSSALDVLADDDAHGNLICIQDHERSDYGFRLPAGTVYRGAPLERATTVDLRGEAVPDTQAEYVREPSVSGAGNYYDGESELVYGDETAVTPFPATYHGDGLPEEGVTPQEYATNDERRGS